MNSPVNLTSSLSTECYRDFWPQPPMAHFIGRSIDLLEEFADENENCFSLTRQGYLTTTNDPSRWNEIKNFWLSRDDIEVRLDDPNYQYGVGLPDWRTQPSGIDLISGEKARILFPYLSEETQGAIHARRCGWVFAQQLGTTLLQNFRLQGTFMKGRVTDIKSTNGAIMGVVIDGSEEISTTKVVNATGPFLQETHQLLGNSTTLPIYNEIHAKIVLKDYLGVIPRDAPMVISDDCQKIDWGEDVQEMIQENPDEYDSRMLEYLPAGVHFRPYGGFGQDSVLMLWECWHSNRHIHLIDPAGIPSENDLDPLYAEIILNGMSKVVPGLSQYLSGENRVEASMDGGYYTRTKENLPLIGEVPECPEGYHVAGCLSGYGIMGSMATGDLVSRLISQKEIPSYASLMSPHRYVDGTLEWYLQEFEHLGSGQI